MDKLIKILILIFLALVVIFLAGCDNGGYLNEGEPTPTPPMPAPAGVKWICYITDLSCGGDYADCDKFMECGYFQEWKP